MVKKIFFSGVMLIFSAAVFAQATAGAKPELTYVFSQDFADGEELFQLNKPAEAIPLFEKIIDDKNVHPAVFVYLGVAYYQVEEYQKSLNICVKGLTRADTDHKVLAYNAGNSAYALGNYARADACYAIAIKEDPDFSAAYLNRANAQLKQDHLEEARANYQTFIDKEPENEQRPAIEQLLALLDEEIVRRANEKPELITPESLNVGNEDMQLGEDIEKIALEDFSADVEQGADDAAVPEVIIIEELIAADDFAAPELPPEELTFASDVGERVSVEVPPAEEPVAGNASEQTVVEETVVREVQQDIWEAEEAARRAREAEKTIEEEIEIPVLPDANPHPQEEQKPLERVSGEEIPAPTMTGDAK